MARWAAALPERTKRLRTVHQYQNVLSCYRDVILRDMEENGLSYHHRAEAASAILRTLFPTCRPQVVTILNPLQADPLTDFVETDGHGWVVTSHLRADSYVHELVHVCLESVLREWIPHISEHLHLLDAVYQPMVRLSYAWDRSASSWVNVFSETLVRTLTLWVLEGQVPDTLQVQLEAIVREGFLYARPIADTLASMNGRQPLSEQWLERCLHACHDAAGVDEGKG